jgi:hypothetical protein
VPFIAIITNMLLINRLDFHLITVRRDGSGRLNATGNGIEFDIRNISRFIDVT